MLVLFNYLLLTMISTNSFSLAKTNSETPPLAQKQPQDFYKIKRRGRFYENPVVYKRCKGSNN